MLRPLIEFDYFGMPIYMIMVLIGFLFACISLSNKQAKLNCTSLMKIRTRRSFIFGFISAVICANVANWFLFPEVLHFPFTQRITMGGFSFYYGMFGFFVVSAIFLRIHKINCKFWINEIIPSVLLFHAFGRIGCSLSGCCFGTEITFLGMDILFPAREMEAIALFIMYFVFELKIKESRFFWYLICYSILRFALEFGRADNRGELFVSWLSPAQITSIAIWVGIGAFLIIKPFIKTKKSRLCC